jgi:hypothetical protein
MSDVNERDAKLIRYLNEAYGKERQLEADPSKRAEAAGQ